VRKEEFYVADSDVDHDYRIADVGARSGESRGPAPNVAGGLVEGTVRKVDVATGTIHVSSGPLGLGEKTLQLSEDTLVKVGDREASLTEIFEGSKVTAYYETRNRKYVATHIDLVPRFRMPEKLIDFSPRLAL
jgi:Cu/Ag efflux protein CusF